MGFKEWLKLLEVGMGGGGPGGGLEPPKQCPYDPEHPEKSAFRTTNLNHLVNPDATDTQDSDLPPAPKKFGKDRFKMKKMKS